MTVVNAMGLLDFHGRKSHRIIENSLGVMRAIADKLDGPPCCDVEIRRVLHRECARLERVWGARRADLVSHAQWGPSKDGARPALSSESKHGWLDLEYLRSYMICRYGRINAKENEAADLQRLANFGQARADAVRALEL